MRGPASRRLWALAAILAVGAFLRFWGISDRGLAHYDEGHLARFVSGPVAAARWAARSILRGEPLTSASLKREFEKRGFPYSYLAAKHGYASLVAVVSSVCGVRDVVPLVLSAAFGAGAILWAFRLGSILAGPAAGLWAAGILAVSPNHLFFSRSAFAHAASAFFLCWALLVYLRGLDQSSRAAGLRRAGLLTGLAFLCHYNLVWFPLLLGACEVLWGLQGRPRRVAAGARGWLGFFAAFLVPLVACEIATRLSQAALGAWIPNVHSYLWEVHYSARDLLGTVFKPARTSPWFNLVHIVRTEGLLYAALLGAALAFSLRGAARCLQSRPKGLLLVGASVGSLLVMYSIPSFRTSRTLLVVFVFGAVLVGALCAAHLRGRGGAIAACVVAAAHLSIVLPLDVRLVRGRSPYPALAEEARARGRWLVAVDDHPVVDFYQPGGEVFVRDDGAFRRIRAARHEPLTLLVVNRGGEYGFDDPMWIREGRYIFVKRVVKGKAGPDRSVECTLPFEFEYMDREFRWDRLFFLSGMPYRVEAYDLDGIE